MYIIKKKEKLDQEAHAHEWSSMGRVFTVKDEQGGSRPVVGIPKEMLGQAFLVVEIERTVDVATVVLVFESTVDDDDVVVVAGVATVEHVDEGVRGDTWQTVGAIVRDEVGPP